MVNYRIPSKRSFKNRSYSSYSYKKPYGIKKYFAPIKKRGSFRKYKRTLKRFPKRKINFRSQEKQLRNAIVSRKFKTFDGMTAANTANMQLQSIDVARVLQSPALIGHIAEYEQFAISYIKVKGKFVGGKVDSFIVPYLQGQELLLTTQSDYIFPLMFQKQTIGAATHIRKQNLLANHKQQRTTPWVDVQQFITNPDSHYQTLLPQIPFFKHQGFVVSDALTSYEVSLYVVTKNKKVQTLNAYTAITEMKVDKVQTDRVRNENDSGYLYTE